MPSSEMDKLKFQFIQSTHKGRWTSYRAYEICSSFYKEAQKISFGGGVTLWTLFEKEVMDKGNLPQMTPVHDEKVMAVAYESCKALKGPTFCSV